MTTVTQSERGIGRAALLALLVLPASFVVVSATLVLGDYQALGGDFAQYLMHARNLLLGRPYSDLLEHYPSVLPAYPALLTIPMRLFGADFYWYGLLNSLMWAGYCVLALRYFAPRLGTAAAAWAFMGVVVFAQFVTHFQQHVQPNILYAFAAMAALCVLRHVETNSQNKPWQLLLLGVVLVLPALVRKEALALFGVVGFCFAMRRQWAWAAVAAVAFVGAALFDAVGSVALEQEATLGELRDRYLAGQQRKSPLAREGLLPAFGYAMTTYVVELVHFVVPKDVTALAHVFTVPFSERANVDVPLLALPIVALFLWGFCRGGLLHADKLFVAAHLLVITAYFVLIIGKGTVPARYALPLLAPFWFYVVTALQAAVHRVSPVLSWAVASAVVAGAVWASVDKWSEPRRVSDAASAPMREVVQWMVENHDDGEIGYVKPRVLTLLLDEAGRRTTVSGLRTEGQAELLLSSGGTLVTRKMAAYGQPAVQAFAEAAGADLVMENLRFKVYRAAPRALNEAAL